MGVACALRPFDLREIETSPCVGPYPPYNTLIGDRQKRSWLNILALTLDNDLPLVSQSVLAIVRQIA
jgi:hypothetical protein